MENDKLFISSKTVELSETSTYLTLKNRLCYYGEANLNNVCLPVDGALEKAETLVNMPVVAKYKLDANGNPDLGGHEMSVNPVTNEVKFGTENVGVHTSVEIKEDTVKVNGVLKTLPCLFADIRIWTRNKNVVAAVKRLFEEGKLTNSWEILVSSYKFDNGIKTLDDYQFEATALLGSAVTPAYDGCASTLSVASADEDPEIIIAEALAKDIASRTEEDEMNKEPKETVEAEQLEHVGEEPEETVAETGTEGAEVVEEPTADTKPETSEEEVASLTEWDLRSRIKKAAEEKIRGWVWVSYHMPAEATVWCEYEYRESELDYVMFTYEVIDDAVVLSEPTYVKLTVTIKDVNSAIAEKTDALLEANETINSLKDEVASLTKYKDMYEQQEAEKEAAEKSAKKDALISYAMKSKLISESELTENAEIAKMIDEVDEAGIKNLIAERFMDSLDNATPEVEVSSAAKNPQSVRVGIEDDDEPASYNDLLNAYFATKKK